MINDKETIFVTNSKVKTYLTKTFGSEIQVAPSERKYESHMVFSSSTSIDDVIKRLRSIDSTKLAAIKIRSYSLLWTLIFKTNFVTLKILEIRGNSFAFLIN